MVLFKKQYSFTDEIPLNVKDVGIETKNHTIWYFYCVVYDEISFSCA
jgi:hypothetical protein